MTDDPDRTSEVADVQIERERLRFDFEARRIEARSRVLQAIFGTMIVGLAAAAFPFAQKFAELTFQERIEDARLRAEQTALETRLELEEAAQNTANQRERREFLNSLAAEARSDDIERRIVLAEFFSHLAHEQEVEKWSAFLEYLKAQQKRFNEERVSLNRIVSDPDAAETDRSRALNRLQQIDRLESPESQKAAPALAPACGVEKIAIEPAPFRVENGLLASAHGAPVMFRETPNKSGALTGGRPKYIVMHYTSGGAVGGAIQHFSNRAANASAHVVIGRSGEVIQMGRFDEALFHAGRSEWNGDVALNRLSVGIELANWGRLSGDASAPRAWVGRTLDPKRVCEAEHRNQPGLSELWEVFTPAQLNAAAGVAAAVARTYDIAPEGVIGNDDISPGRKSDPGPAFPMEAFREALRP